jgi:DNA ligase-1
MSRARLVDLVRTSDAVRRTSGRIEKRQLFSTLFASLEPDDLRLAACYLAGEVPQGKLNVAWAALSRAGLRSAGEPQPALFEAAASPAAAVSPALQELDRQFEALKQASGAGSVQARVATLRRLLDAVPAEEQAFVRGLLLGELRHGALRAAVVDALAETFAVDPEALRRAIMFSGSFPDVVQALARAGAAALAQFGPRPLVPIEPMLAVQAADAAAAFADASAVAVETKLDGVRVQAHRSAQTICVFTRNGRDVTTQVPGVVDVMRRLDVRSIVLDGEVIGTNASGRPLAFQDLIGRFTRQSQARASGPDLFEAQVHDGALRAVYFDLLELDGEAFVDRPYNERVQALDRSVPAPHRMPRSIVHTPEELQACYESAIAAGHEGVMVKRLDAPYTAGRRGAAWVKLKPALTLDLVILAAEWGHGRRHGWLSNLHLGAVDPASDGGFAMLGKTFKGLTDDMLRALTRDLSELQTHGDAHVVHVRPERVVEIAFDSIQRSRRYASGYALRFARVKRFRPDKHAADANTLDDVRRLAARPS